MPTFSHGPGPRGGPLSLWAELAESRPDWAGPGGARLRLRPPEGAAAHARPAGLGTEVDVTGSRASRGAQRELCGAAGAQRPPCDKEAWAGVGAAEAGRARRGKRGWGWGPGTPPPHTCQSLKKPGAQSAGRR